VSVLLRQPRGFEGLGSVGELLPTHRLAVSEGNISWSSAASMAMAGGQVLECVELAPLALVTELPKASLEVLE
jgi:hypothetical protein